MGNDTQYELIEALDPENMDKMLHHKKENIEPQSYLIGSPMSIIKFILKTDLKEYKIVKKDAQSSSNRCSCSPQSPRTPL